jgi:hypothetical protein
MPRYVPTAEEQAAIDRLTLAGYAVVRQRTYDALRERLRVADCMTAMEIERREGVEHWARRECDEQRRLSARLNAVCTAAAALGVSITDINAALDAADTKD